MRFDVEAVIIFETNWFRIPAAGCAMGRHKVAIFATLAVDILAPIKVCEKQESLL
jgi:hypothetical protein